MVLLDVFGAPAVQPQQVIPHLLAQQLLALFIQSQPLSHIETARQGVRVQACLQVFQNGRSEMLVDDGDNMGQHEFQDGRSDLLVRVFEGGRQGHC